MTQLIRRAMVADLDALTRLRIDFMQDAHGDAPLPIDFTETTRRFYEDRLAEPGSLVFWVAERDGQVVAQAMISLFQRLPNLSNPNGLEAYVSNFYIDSAYRRQGIGTALLEALVADARDRAVGRLWLYASQAGEGLYAGAGFEHVVRAVPEMELNLADLPP